MIQSEGQSSENDNEKLVGKRVKNLEQIGK